MTAPSVVAVMSYNLKDYGKSSQDTRRQQHALIRAHEPDLLCLQEIWDERVDLAGLRRHAATLSDELGMRALAVPSPLTHCHLAMLWNPAFELLSEDTDGTGLWHGLGVVELDVGAGVPLRAAVGHLAPKDPARRFADARLVTGKLADPDQATVFCADMNSLGVNDPEPDWTQLHPESKVWRHVYWTDSPQAERRADRRPAELLHRSGLHDAATYLQAPWQATGGHWPGDMPRRLDAIWTTRPEALRHYQVIGTPLARELSDFSEHENRSHAIDPRELSDHLPIMVELDTGAL